ncbi:hypothetical protein THRCLA_21281 [Thraustotheca clavata]|uniref:Selenoprotein F/M domain-containing protein n=1 Tax=Thraustotheca clavata TaxID=74557 RepID=A0A1V9ZY57_9STRA|nr:hypothetical protein THRCLA_21281 [Thraustotheca clavata]
MWRGLVLASPTIALLLSRQECISLGLDSLAIDCESCLDDQDRRADCLQCCSVQNNYERASLSFVQSHAQRAIPRLSIEYHKGQKPHLLLYDAHGTMQRKVNIEQWSDEAIRDYVTMTLGQNDMDKDEL